MPSHVYVGTEYSALAKIREKDINLVLLPRPNDLGITDFIQSHVNESDFPQLKVRGYAKDIISKLDERFGSWTEKKGCTEFLRVRRLQKKVN